MNSKVLIIVVTIFIILAILIALGPFYILQEGQQAVVTRFGKIVDTQQQAGLKLKMPFIDNVVRYSKRILTWDGKAQEKIPTKEQLFIWVDVTARWKITDPILFYSSVTYMDSAQIKLNEIIHSSIKTVISNNMLREAVRNSNLINEISTKRLGIEVEEETLQKELEALGSRPGAAKQQDKIEKGREVLSNDIFSAVSTITPQQFGITLIDIIVRQIRYSDDLTESVYNRMIKDRNQVAQIFRSSGEGQKAEWFGKLQNEQKTILSQAYKTAEEIKGRADARATKIYNDAYSKDTDFFEFWRSVESYRKTIPKLNKTITTELEYFRYLDKKNPR